MPAKAVGALAGLLIGIAALVAVLAVSVQCLPFRIARPPGPWPAVCADPAYAAVSYLAFPVNLITDDLSRAVYLAPMSLLVYAFLGVLVASLVRRYR